MTIRGSAAQRPLGLKLIATLKFVKAAALFTAGCVSLNLMNPERAGWVQDWLEGLSLDQNHHLVPMLAGHARGMMDLGGPHRYSHFAVAGFLLAGLFVVEGVGLALARRWAEYLTVAVTTSFMPVEVASSWHRWGLLRAGTIVVNLCVVVYLIIQIRTTSGRFRKDGAR